MCTRVTVVEIISCNLQYKDHCMHNFMEGYLNTKNECISIVTTFDRNFFETMCSKCLSLQHTCNFSHTYIHQAHCIH